MFSEDEVYASVGDKLEKRIYVRVFETVGSTNDELKRLARRGFCEGTVIAAGEQTAGKGRLGRSFCSPKDVGLYMSILLRPGVEADDALAITTAAGTAVSEAIDALCGVQSGIKWVNDVYVDGRKVCGILTESSSDRNGVSFAVLGIGVNVSDREFPEDIRDRAGSLGADPDMRPKLAGGILTRFFEYYDAFPSRAYMDEYRRRSLLTGKTIVYESGGNEHSALVTGIDDAARLIVRGDDGNVKYLTSGEVRIKI